jgi:hypothetical protein
MMAEILNSLEHAFGVIAKASEPNVASGTQHASDAVAASIRVGAA